MANRRLQQQSLDSPRNKQHKQQDKRQLSNWPALIALEAGLALLIPIVITGLSFLFWQHTSDATPIATPTAAAPSTPGLAMADQPAVVTSPASLSPASVLSVANPHDDAAVSESSFLDVKLEKAVPAKPALKRADNSLSAALDAAVAQELAMGKAFAVDGAVDTSETEFTDTYDPPTADPEPALTAPVAPAPSQYSSPNAPQLADTLAAELEAFAVELDLRADPDAVGELLHPVFSVSGRTALVNLLRGREDLAGLPLRDARDCEVGNARARRMTVVSTGLRQIPANETQTKLVELLKRTDDGIVSKLAPVANRSLKRQVVSSNSNDSSEILDRKHKTKATPVTSTLHQMLQVESKEVRLKLVEHLNTTQGAEATAALADRALFDLSGMVRRAAAEALRARPRQDYQRQLVSGLRYPWPPVASHAAQALVQIGDVSAVALVKPLLAAPDPSYPRLDENHHWVKSELVRVNHMRNCLLCHSASHHEADLVRAMIPSPGQPLPAIYYDHISSSGNNFVRASSVYLKQDFSVMHRVANAHPWPEQQRFDYFVRTRRLTAVEVAEMPRGRGDADYPQRESVQFVLRELGNSGDRDGNRMVAMQD